MLTTEQIYADLQPSWWMNDVIPGNTLPSAMVYFKTDSGNYASYSSVGALDSSRSASDVNEYVQDYLMWECARQLENGGCTGSITNIQPAGYQVVPIYFK